jgi:GTP-binding protein Era
MKSGFVSIVGRPNVGKSTLLNTIMERKIAITSIKAQTTRNNIMGVYHEEGVQIVFIDTPGIHKPKNNLGKLLNNMAYYTIEDTDVIVFVVDISEAFGPGDKFVIERLKNIDKPVILVLNKIDRVTKEVIMKKIVQYKDLYDFAEIVPLSVIKKEDTDKLINVLKKYITDDIKYYDDDYITDKNTEFFIAEYVREKILNNTNDEVPHSITCITESIKQTKESAEVNVLIIVERDGLKKIIIGHNGDMIKKIGIEARKDIEELLGKRVYLNLYVKTVKKWRDKEKYLSEFGFKNLDI